MYIIDKGDVWSWLKDMDTVIYEDGTTAPLTTDLLEIPFGQHSGTKLSDFMDVGYLNWMLKDAVDKGDVFMEKCVTLRLLELK